LPKVYRQIIDPIYLHYHYAHGKHNDDFNEEREKEEIKLLIISLSNAGAQPGAMMIHFLDADTTDVTVARSRRSIDITGHTEFDSINLNAFWKDI
jgi:hypothetical protein